MERMEVRKEGCKLFDVVCLLGFGVGILQYIATPSSTSHAVQHFLSMSGLVFKHMVFMCLDNDIS